VLVGIFFLVTIGSIAWLRTLHPTIRRQPNKAVVPQRVEE